MLPSHVTVFDVVEDFLQNDHEMNDGKSCNRKVFFLSLLLKVNFNLCFISLFHYLYLIASVHHQIIFDDVFAHRVFLGSLNRNSKR